MNTHTNNLTTAAQKSWVERFGEYCYRTSMPRVLQYFRNEATFQYEGMINDLETSMASELEDVIAAQLPLDQGYLLKTSQVLLPAMAERLHADLTFVDERQRKALESQCERCNQVGRCWLAMRRGESAGTCASFCPNADDLIAVQ